MALTDNLIAYWKLDEASGDALDAHSTNNLTDTNTVTNGTGKINGARQFTRANNEYFTLGDNAALSTGDIDFTFSIWSNTTTSASYQGMVSKGAANQEEYLLYLSAGLPEYIFRVYDGTSLKTLLGGIAPTVSGWDFIICWHDSVNNTINMQLNNGTVSSVAHTTGVIDSTTGFFLGQFADLSGSFSGLIDEVGFWKRVLTSQERTDLYNSGNGLAYPFGSGGTLHTIPRPALLG